MANTLAQVQTQLTQLGQEIQSILVAGANVGGPTLAGLLTRHTALSKDLAALAGAAQSITHYGQGVPPASLGSNNDVYTDVLNGYEYHKASGAWSFKFNKKGAPGKTPVLGTDYRDGEDGVDGADGSRIFDRSYPPTPADNVSIGEYTPQENDQWFESISKAAYNRYAYLNGTWRLVFQKAEGVVLPPAANTAPVISFVAPASGATVTKDQPLTLTATATDNVAVASVEFFNGNSGVSLGIANQNGNTYTLPYTPTVAGALSLIVKATDGGTPALSSQATITITVATTAPVNQIPTANAGSDASIQLPTNQIALLGSGSDADGSVTGYAWRQVTGPNTATGIPATTQNAVAGGLVAGSYSFGFRTTDNAGGQSVEDFVSITVQPPVATSGYFPVTFTDSIFSYPGDTGTVETTSAWAIILKRLQTGANYAGGFLHQGYPGGTAADMLNSAYTNSNQYVTDKPGGISPVQHLLSQLPADKIPVVLIAFGANGGTVAQIRAIHDAIKAARPGAITIASPLLNRLDGSYRPNGIPNRAAINDALAAGVGFWCDDFVHLENVPQIFASEAPDNNKYFASPDFTGQSYVHLRTPGTKLLAEPPAQALARRMGLTLAPLVSDDDAPEMVNTGITQTNEGIRFGGGGWTNFSPNSQYITGFGGASDSISATFGFTFKCYGFRIVTPVSNLAGAVKAVEGGTTIATGTQYSTDPPQAAGAPRVIMSKYYGSTLATHSVDFYHNNTGTGVYLFCNLIQFCDAQGNFPPIPAPGPVTDPVAAGETIEQNDTRILYGGQAWDLMSSNPNYSQTTGAASTFNDLVAYAQVKFTGSGIRFKAPKAPICGNLELVIDGAVKDQQSQYNGSVTPAVTILETSGLPAGTVKTAVVRFLQSNPNPGGSGNLCILLDTIEVF